MNDDEFKRKVIEGPADVNKQLHGLAQRLDGIDQRLDGIERCLSRVEQRLDEHSKHFDQVKGVVGQIYEGVQAVLDQQEIEIKERAHINIVLNRHERWITDLAKNANLKLRHD